MVRLAQQEEGRGRHAAADNTATEAKQQKIKTAIPPSLTSGPPKIQ